jgi:hypothetical protein
MTTFHMTVENINSTAKVYDFSEPSVANMTVLVDMLDTLWSYDQE